MSKKRASSKGRKVWVWRVHMWSFGNDGEWMVHVSPARHGRPKAHDIAEERWTARVWTKHHDCKLSDIPTEPTLMVLSGTARTVSHA